jgi:hypothetical protein
MSLMRTRVLHGVRAKFWSGIRERGLDCRRAGLVNSDMQENSACGYDGGRR